MVDLFFLTLVGPSGLYLLGRFSSAHRPGWNKQTAAKAFPSLCSFLLVFSVFSRLFALAGVFCKRRFRATVTAGLMFPSLEREYGRMVRGLFSLCSPTLRLTPLGRAPPLKSDCDSQAAFLEIKCHIL